VRHFARTVRWESTADPARFGLEIDDIALTNCSLAQICDRALAKVKGDPPVFILARFAPAPAHAIADALKSFDRWVGAHVCIAVEQEKLLTMEPYVLRAEKVGIVLDGVHAGTPLNSVCAQFVEAVRFDAGFLEQARRDMRLHCVADAMLKLTHDLGLATLGSMRIDRRAEDDDLAFDYVRSGESVQVA
jgi:hypothetical protein